MTMKKLDFKQKVYELAFGEDAINKDYSDQEVIDTLTFMVQELPRFKEKLDRDFEALGMEVDEEDFEYYQRVIKDIEDFENENLHD